jgi:hypothetical protein
MQKITNSTSCCFNNEIHPTLDENNLLKQNVDILKME